MDTTTKKNPISPKQREAILEALKDPEKKRQVSAVLMFELLSEENKRIIVQKIEELADKQGASLC